MFTNGIWYFIQWLHYLALTLWIGGITFLSAVAAPSVHGSMASKAIAGQIVGKMLKRLNILEITCCVFLLATSCLAFRFVRDRSHWLWYLMLAVLVMGTLTSYYTFYLTPRLETVKTSVPTFDSLSQDHPAKIEFHRLHKLYVRLMSLNLVLGLLVLYGSVVILKS